MKKLIFRSPVCVCAGRHRGRVLAVLARSSARKSTRRSNPRFRGCGMTMRSRRWNYRLQTLSDRQSTFPPTTTTAFPFAPFTRATRSTLRGTNRQTTWSGSSNRIPRSCGTNQVTSPISAPGKTGSRPDESSSTRRSITQRTGSPAWTTYEIQSGIRRPAFLLPRMGPYRLSDMSFERRAR